MPKRINTALASTIGGKLDELIDEFATSKSVVADDLNVERSQITRIINGSRYPSLELLVDFADYFKVSIDYLLGRE